MKIRIEWTGTTPLLMRNIRLADPDEPITRQLKEITSKLNKTEDDRKAIERLEWFGGIYADARGPVILTGSIRRCLEEAAAISKKKKAVRRALSFGDLAVPLVYEGPRDIEQLWELPQFRNRSMVGVNGKRTPRVRPQFRKWALVADAELLTDVLDLDAVGRFSSLAGRAEGLGDNRVNGYGRFDGAVQGL